MIFVFLSCFSSTVWTEQKTAVAAAIHCDVSVMGS